MDIATTPSTKTTPRDFFLWLAAMASFYWAVIAFVTLLSEYINYTYPDPLAYYADPYSGAMRFSMASLIVLSPLAVALIYLIRRTVLKDSSKERTWVRRWAIMLTLFVAGATVAVDLITLLTTFLGGELTTRFLLKVLVILLVALGVFLHFVAEMRGYWFKHPRRAHLVAGAALLLVLLTVAAGFFIVGSPRDMRMMRYDQQKVGDLQSLQYQIVTFYQQKQELPETLAEIVDPLTGFVIPQDPQGGAYRYERVSSESFKLCASFNHESRDVSGRGAYHDSVAMPAGMNPEDNWRHGAGESCFDRTIDPERYPPQKPVRGS
ncbi:MAG TPA: DUF5671 domain-containing protein [Candidatus Paceibacterota bacterium]|jgi:hypothetical protein